jgi:homoserine O-succinyltransferase/O-acetyltransferase
MQSKKILRVAVLDLYDNLPNEGMRCIRALVKEFAESIDAYVVYDEFDVRYRNEMADLSYDLYISSGGPGSPIDSIGSLWEEKFFRLMDGILAHNEAGIGPKKNVLLICHSFQIFSRHYGFARVSKRKSTSFGVFPIEKVEEAGIEPLFDKLNDPFWVVDSRDYQVTQPNMNKLEAWGSKILCYEKERPHVALERAVMAIHFNDNILGTQFHPEADPEGMLRYLKREDKKKAITEHHGAEKYQYIVEHIDDEDKVVNTYRSIIPGILKKSAKRLFVSA